MPFITGTGFWPLLDILLWQLVIYALVKTMPILNMLFVVWLKEVNPLFVKYNDIEIMICSQYLSLTFGVR